MFKAKEYGPLILRYNNGASIRLSDVATVIDSVADVRNDGVYKGKPSVVLIVFKRPGANIIETVDAIERELPYLKNTIPGDVDLNIAMDRTTTIRSSLKEVKHTLIIAIALVIWVMYYFLGNARAALIPGIAVPLSLAGTFGVMYLLGYSLDNLSLMALTIATGFVVDDAVVVTENITRHMELGKSPLQAALIGVREVGFTVISISLSLVAVFIPILLMGGIIGRLFREFSITLTIAILISMVISLTVTPTMAVQFLKPHVILPGQKGGQKFDMMGFLKDHYAKALGWVLNHDRLMLGITLLTVVLNIYLFMLVSKGFFPQQDTGRVLSTLYVQQDTSFPMLKEKLHKITHIVQKDPGVEGVAGVIGGSASSASNSGRVFINLQPLEKRNGESAEIVINRLRKSLDSIAGTTLYMRAAQDITVGGRMTNGQYQYTLSAYDLETLNIWAPRILEAFKKIPGIVDVNNDQLNHGRALYVKHNRDTAARLGVSAVQLDSTLYNAFGQAPVSTQYTLMNQYFTILNVDMPYWANPDILDNFYLTMPGQDAPLGAFAEFIRHPALLVVNHQSQMPAATLSFNLLPGYALGDVVDKINETMGQIGVPLDKITGSFQGTAKAFQESLKSQPYLILAALFAVYIVLGMLYESTIHPLTILSTLPSAGVGALLALIVTGGELNIIALIGILLLIGIVKKNAIMIIDFTLELQRSTNKTSREAVYEASILRFRPIMMTTAAALLSAIPLALGRGVGSEMRSPLGIAIIGGLIASQMLTLFTIPVIYLTLESAGQRLRVFARAFWNAKLRHQ